MECNEPEFRNKSEETKFNIIKYRLSGLSYSEISAKLNISRNYVFKILKHFQVPPKKNDMSRFFKKNLTQEDIDVLACASFEKLLTDKEDSELASRYNISEAYLHKCYHLLSDKHRAFAIKRNEVYNPEIERWRRQKNISVKNFAKMCGCSVYVMERILAGETDNPKDIAHRIYKVTKIKIR